MEQDFKEQEISLTCRLEKIEFGYKCTIYNDASQEVAQASLIGDSNPMNLENYVTEYTRQDKIPGLTYLVTAALCEVASKNGHTVKCTGAHGGVVVCLDKYDSADEYIYDPRYKNSTINLEKLSNVAEERIKNRSSNNEINAAAWTTPIDSNALKNTMIENGSKKYPHLTNMKTIVEEAYEQYLVNKSVGESNCDCRCNLM